MDIQLLNIIYIPLDVLNSINMHAPRTINSKAFRVRLLVYLLLSLVGRHSITTERTSVEKNISYVDWTWVNPRAIASKYCLLNALSCSNKTPKAFLLRYSFLLEDRARILSIPIVGVIIFLQSS